jgi:hypothetical protein
LRKLAGDNANPLKPDQSRDFKKIKIILQRRRTLEEVLLLEKKIFRYIKALVLEAENDEPETINNVLGEIYSEKFIAFFTKNVDKNRQHRR